MDPLVAIVACWLLFGGTHLGLTTRRVRAALVARLGEGGFGILYFAIAGAAFALLVRTWAATQHAGPPGLAAAVGPTLRLALWAVAGLGATLAVAGLVAYPGSPMELGATRTKRPTRLARVTRHPFFVGLAVVALAHVPLATHATGAVFFAGLALFPLLGAWHQDRKLRAARGEPYAAYCRETSVVPFAALAAGRTRLPLRDVPVVPLAIGVAGATALRWAHPHVLAWDGMAVVAATVGGALFFAAMGVVRLALRAGQGRALATAGGMLVLHVGLAHEVVGARLYPDGPALLGGPLAWHAVGLTGIVLGVLLTGGALGFLALPLRALATAALAAGAAFVAADAVVHGGFHFFAATLAAGACLVLAAARDLAAAPRAG